MALFVVRHQHNAKVCPAKDPKMGAMLLQHLSRSNAAKAGITIRAEAVVDGRHTLHLIVDAADKTKVQQFMAPFAQAGTVRVLPANPCEVVVKRLGC